MNIIKSVFSAKITDSKYSNQTPLTLGNHKRYLIIVCEYKLQMIMLNKELAII